MKAALCSAWCLRGCLRLMGILALSALWMAWLVDWFRWSEFCMSHWLEPPMMQERSFCVVVEVLCDVAFCNRADEELILLSEGQHSCPGQLRWSHLAELSFKGCSIWIEDVQELFASPFMWRKNRWLLGFLMGLSWPPVKKLQNPPGNFCIMPWTTVSWKVYLLKIIHFWDRCFRHRHFIKSLCKLLCNQSSDCLSWELNTLKIKVPIVVTLLLPYQVQSFWSLCCVIGTSVLWPDSLLNKPEWEQSRIRLKWND